MKFVKQTKTNLQKYVHPSSLNHLEYADVQKRKPKKSQQKSHILKKTTVRLPSRSYYSMVLGHGATGWFEMYLFVPFDMSLASLASFGKKKTILENFKILRTCTASCYIYTIQYCNLRINKVPPKK